jgi:hypothetical protein
MVGTSAKGQTPLTNDNWKRLEYVGVFLDGSQLLCKGSSVPFILKTMIPMDFEAYSISSISPHHCVPSFSKSGERSLKNGQNHGYAVC